MTDDCNVNPTAFNKIHVPLKLLIQTDYPEPPNYVFYDGPLNDKSLYLTKEEFEFLGQPETIDILITPGVKND